MVRVGVDPGENRCVFFTVVAAVRSVLSVRVVLSVHVSVLMDLGVVGGAWKKTCADASTQRRRVDVRGRLEVERCLVNAVVERVGRPPIPVRKKGKKTAKGEKKQKKKVVFTHEKKKQKKAPSVEQITRNESPKKFLFLFF